MNKRIYCRSVAARSLGDRVKAHANEASISPASSHVARQNEQNGVVSMRPTIGRVLSKEVRTSGGTLL